MTDRVSSGHRRSFHRTNFFATLPRPGSGDGSYHPRRQDCQFRKHTRSSDRCRELIGKTNFGLSANEVGVV